MRAQEVFDKLKAGNVDEGLQDHVTKNAIVNASLLRERLTNLAGIPGFAEDDLFLAKSIIFRTTQNEIRVLPQEGEELKSLLQRYFKKLTGLFHYLNAVISQQDSNAIFIKLPPTEDFREAIKDQMQFATAIEQAVYIKNIEGKVSIKSWERGSLWIELALGGPLAVSLIGSLAWAAAVVKKKNQEAKLHEQYVRTLKIKADHLEVVLNAQRELIAILVDTEARNIASMHVGEDTQPETIERLKFTIKEFSGLIERGAEIHPALQAPETVKELFPNFRDILGIESKTQMLK